MSNADHPIWFLLRTIVMLCALLLILYLNAEEFDDNEMEIAKWFLGAAMGASGLEYFTKRNLNGKKK